MKDMKGEGKSRKRRKAGRGENEAEGTMKKRGGERRGEG